jgi:phosphoribosylformimino-5-aminoimidazole carboxamide ribotide isomerase
MNVFPAIDLLNGNAVRLTEGRRDQATIFSSDPVQFVATLCKPGVTRLHVVDLDGAFAGMPKQHELLARIISASPIPVEVGGGIRDRAAVESVFRLGAQFVVLGTAAVRDPEMVEAVCRAYPRQIVIAVDARDGIVAVDGWTTSGDVTAIELGQRADAWGCAALLYTDIGRDGTHRGPNVEATAALARAVRCDVIASGGVGTLRDLAMLRDAEIPSVVVGRALYDGHFTIEEAVQIATSPHGSTPPC